MITENARPARARWRSFGPELLVLFGGAVFATLGRGRWANVTEDHGFWYSAAQSLLKGGRAMHEVRLQYGPVSLWILEGACRIFGSRVSTLVVLQFVVGLTAILGLQVFSRRFLPPIERWLSAMILVALIVWMAGPGNLLYPCAFAMSHAFLLLVATLLLHPGPWGVKIRGATAIPGALAGVTFLTKQEFGVAAIAGIAALTFFGLGTWRAKARSLAISGVAFLAVYFGILEFVRGGETLQNLVSANILWPWVPIPQPWQVLYRRTLGLDDPIARGIEAADNLAILLAFGGTAWVAIYRRAIRVRAVILAAALITIWLVWYWRWTEGSHFRPMTLALPAILGGIVLVADRALRQKDTGARRSAAPCLAVGAGALLLLQREGYRGAIDAYYSGMGYVLAVPVIVPLLWWAIGGPRGAGRRRGVALALLVILISRFGYGRLRRLEGQWAQTLPFSTPRGTVHIAAGSLRGLAETARFLKTNTRPGDPILMMPQTLGLDFLLDRRNLSFFPWISPGFLTPESERELIQRCEASPPKVVVISLKSLGVLRSGDFGHGFADDLVRWLDARYPRQESDPHGRWRRLLPPVGATGFR